MEMLTEIQQKALALMTQERIGAIKIGAVWVFPVDIRADEQLAFQVVRRIELGRLTAANVIDAVEEER